VPGRTDAVAPDARSVGERVAHHFHIVGHENQRSLREGLQIHVHYLFAHGDGCGMGRVPLAPDVHALWCDCKNMRRTEIWDKWFHRYGRARIEPVNSRDDVADYCAKYVTKENTWWGVNLLGQRHPVFKQFKLE